MLKPSSDEQQCGRLVPMCVAVPSAGVERGPEGLSEKLTKGFSMYSASFRCFNAAYTYATPCWSVRSIQNGRSSKNHRSKLRL